jgi:hypothetical protein
MINRAMMCKNLNFSDYLYPLDLTSASAHRAWSVRRVRSAYAGIDSILRRSSDNTATNVSFDTNTFVSGSSSVSAGGNLSTWQGASNLFANTLNDQSSSAVNAAQATLASQPQFILDGGSAVNNKPVLSASGANVMSASTGVSGPQSFSLFVVVGGVTSTAFMPFFCVESGTANVLLEAEISNGFFRTALRSASTGGYGGTAGAGTTIISGKYSQFSWIVTYNGVSGTREQIFQNGSSVYDTTYGTQWTHSVMSSPTINLFERAWLSNFFTGRIPELLFFSSAVSSADRQIIEKSQMGFFNIR